jgi:hypothetical protein
MHHFEEAKDQWTTRWFCTRRSVEEANSEVTRFVQRLKHSMTGDHDAQYGIMEMTNKIEEQDFCREI